MVPDLSDPVTKLPLIGEKYAKRLKRLEIRTIRDLLYHFPSRYQDFSKIKKIRDLVADDEVTVVGEVVKIGIARTKTGKLLTKAAIADETGAIGAIWFNQPYLSRTIKEGIKIYLAGRVERSSGKLAFVNPIFETQLENTNLSGLATGSDPGAKIHTGRLVAVYPETSHVSSKWLRARIANALRLVPVEDSEFEFIPERILRARNLLPWGKALRAFHFPANKNEAAEARRRFAFEELLLFNLRALERRRHWNARKLTKKIDVKNNAEKIKEFVRNLPFTLTTAQERAVREVLSDLNKPTPMNRLLEGDVGSGKTVVAAIAVYACFLNGARAVIMAPTEILANQHFRTLNELLGPYGVKCALCTGSRKSNEASVPNTQGVQDHAPPRRNTESTSEYEGYDLWIGTHALFHRKGNFKNVGLVVIDEQHRFGVEQRAKLVKKAAKPRGFSDTKPTPHILTLTATPIPRSLALTVYGDLDLSIIDELPPGRKRIKTFVVPNEKRKAGYSWIRKRVGSGEQAFIICPLIEESEKESMRQVKAATAEYEKLRKGVFSGLSLGLLHGRLKAREKSEVVHKFRRGEYQILVSTPVVEVGIDIPNATIMVIEAAERFGLASLHQLRGRVGRGDKESYCFLFAERAGRDVFKRLKALEGTTSGFELAELDLKLRGPGEIYGTKQHGLAEMKVADLANTKLLKAAREDAQRIATAGLSPKLKRELDRFTTALVEPN